MAKRLIPNLNNSQKIRVILNGVYINTTLGGIENFANSEQRIALSLAAHKIGVSQTSNQPITGFASNVNGIEVQVDLI